jgi:hypothetical protein
MKDSHEEVFEEWKKIDVLGVWFQWKMVEGLEVFFVRVVSLFY